METDPVAVAVRALLEEEGKEEWKAQLTELLRALEVYVPEATRKTKSWPKTAKTLGSWIAQGSDILTANRHRC